MSWLCSGDATTSALIGASIGVAGAYFVQWLQNKKQLRTARMRVANDLRHWMSATASRIYDLQNFESSEGQTGEDRIDIPSFRFEESPEQVALLDRKTGNRLFELIHLKDDATSVLEGTAEFREFEDAKDQFRGKVAKLFLDVLQTYQNICERLDWPPATYSDNWKTTMEGEVLRFERIEAAAAASSREDFGDFVPAPETAPAR